MRRFTTTLVAIVAFSFASTVGAQETAKVAFVLPDATGGHTIVIQTVDGESVGEIPNGVVPRWTPEGKIVFSSNGVAFIADGDGTNVRSLGFETGVPVASEELFLFDGNIGMRPVVFVVRRDGGAPVSLGIGSAPVTTDGAKAIFEGADSTHLVSVDLTSVLAGEKPVQERIVAGENPTLLKDGRLVYVQDHPVGNPLIPEIRVRDLMTGQDEILVSNSRAYYVTRGGKREYVVYAPVGENSPSARAISPDGGTSFELSVPFGPIYGDISPRDGARAVQPDTPGLRLTTLGWLKSQ